MQQRIRWDDSEKEELIKRTANIVLRHPGTTYLEALRGAQDSFLPLERRRKITNLQAVPWLTEAVDAEITVLKNATQPSHNKEIQIVEQTIIVPLKLVDIPTDDLIAELFRRFASLGSNSIITQISNTLATTIRNELPNAISRLRQVSTQEIKEKKKKILIIGLLPEQINEIEKAYGTSFELSFWKDGNPQTLRQTAPYQDKIYVMKKFVSHSHQDILRSAGVNWSVISGVISELRAVLDSYFFEVYGA